jgi:transposase InsO family protein
VSPHIAFESSVCGGGEYTRQRLHSYLDYQSPAEYEEAYLAA